MFKQSSKHLAFFSICLCFSLQSFSQADKTVIGTWKGTSICQVKNSPCHDETVVYHISVDKKTGGYAIDAYKIVDGAEDEMGILVGSYDAAKHLLTAHYRADDLWEFKIDGDKMDGTLTTPRGLYRIIKLKKEN